MTLEATCRPDTGWIEQAIPTPREAADGGPQGPPDARVPGAAFDSVEDAIAAGCLLPCQEVDPDLFFAESPADVEVAKALCADCPVRALCLTAALERREPWGVWGGEWFVSGEAVTHKRPRGRPRKDGCVAPGQAIAPRQGNDKEVAA